MWNETKNNAATIGGLGRLESPLVGAQDLVAANQARQSNAFRLRERPFLELVNLRGDVRDAAFMSAVRSVLGASVPVMPNTVTQASECDILWLGPDEWLVRSIEPRAPVLEAKLGSAFAGLFAAAVDVGSGYTVLEVSGTHVRDVLARGCPLDFHPSVLARGQCAQSHYFKASIVLVPLGSDTYEIVVRRSFADYFCRIMLDAAAPFLL